MKTVTQFHFYVPVFVRFFTLIGDEISRRPLLLFLLLLLLLMMMMMMLLLLLSEGGVTFI